jgi:hypothetical protein
MTWVSRVGCKRGEHKAEVFRRVSHQSEYMEENRKEQKERYKRERGGHHQLSEWV